MGYEHALYKVVVPNKDVILIFLLKIIFFWYGSSKTFLFKEFVTDGWYF